MIESGTHAPGVAAGDFRLPPSTALRYERPAEALRPFFPSYAVLDSDPAVFAGTVSWMLPNWAMIRIVLDERAQGVAIGNRRYGALGSMSVYGVTSRAMPVSISGGVSVVVDISPRGWARFFGSSAEVMSDRVAPLDQMLHGGGAALLANLAASDRGPAVKGLLDRFFLERLPPPHFDDTMIARVTGLLSDPGAHNSVRVAAELGVSGAVMLRLTKRHFGFPPNILWMRARFLRAMCQMIIDGQQRGAAIVPAGYHDASHITRDATRFLGMTPRRFMAMDMTYLRAKMRARMLVFGAYAPPLDVRTG